MDGLALLRQAAGAPGSPSAGTPRTPRTPREPDVPAPSRTAVSLVTAATVVGAMRQWALPHWRTLRRVAIRVKHRHLAPAWNRWFAAMQALRERERMNRQKAARQRVVGVVRASAPGQRNEHQLEVMRDWASHTKALGGLSRGTYDRLFQAVRHRAYQDGDIVCLQGTPGNEYIVPLTGRISFFAVDKRAERRNLLDFPERRRRRCRREAERGRFGRHVANAHLGEGFGEMALLEDGGLRSLSAVAMDDTEVLLLRRDEYRALLQERHRNLQRLHAKVDFLRSLDLFKDWPNTTLSRVAYALKERHYSRGQTIIRDMTDALSTMYVVRSGTCELRVQLDVEEDEHHHMHLVRGKKASASASDEGGDAQAALRARNLASHARKENIDVCLIGKGEIVGGGALLRGWNTQNAKLLAFDDVVTLEIRAHRLEHLASHRSHGRAASMVHIQQQQTARKEFQQEHFEHALRVRDELQERIAEVHEDARSFATGCYRLQPLGIYGRKQGYVRKFMRAPMTPAELALMQGRQAEMRGSGRGSRVPGAPGRLGVASGAVRRAVDEGNDDGEEEEVVVVPDDDGGDTPRAPREKRTSPSRRPSSAPPASRRRARPSFALTMHAPPGAMAPAPELELVTDSPTVEAVEARAAAAEEEAAHQAPHSHLLTLDSPRPSRRPRPRSAVPYAQSKSMSRALRQEQLLQPRSAAFAEKRASANRLLRREHGALAALGPPDVEIKHPAALRRPPSASLSTVSLTHVKVPVLKPRPYSASDSKPRSAARPAQTTATMALTGAAAAPGPGRGGGGGGAPKAQAVFLDAITKAKDEWKHREAQLWRDAYRPGRGGGDTTSLNALEARALIECGGMLKGKLRVRPKHMRS